MITVLVTLGLLALGAVVMVRAGRRLQAAAAVVAAIPVPVDEARRRRLEQRRAELRDVVDLTGHR